VSDVDFCVVGAGFAGLTAALRLKRAGRSVALLEARDRVGGRTFTEYRPDGMWVDRGGAWIGPGQDRIYALMAEFGVPEYKQHNDGDAMMIVDGKKHRYGGTIPWTMSPWAVTNLGLGLLSIEKMCKSIPREAPWEAKQAEEWDRISVGEWLDKNTMSRQAREMLDMALAGPYTSAASETSLLWMLLQMASAGGPTFVISGKGGSQDARPVGGMGAVYGPMAAEIGDSLHLSQPVRQITQDADGATVRADGLTVRAGRVIVAIPLAIATSIVYEPMLPVDRAFLHQRMPSGAIFKTSVVYDEPFWRADGLSGQSAAPGSLATLTIDACTNTGNPGVMCAITEGTAARRLGRLNEAERKAAIIGELVDRFGDKARTPVE
jgi:monoamine oxidase